MRGRVKIRGMGVDTREVGMLEDRLSEIEREIKNLKVKRKDDPSFWQRMKNYFKAAKEE
jgi:hypothetical protein